MGKNQAPVAPLTVAQAKAGLIAAAEQGLIDGSELTYQWVQGLQNAIRKTLRQNGGNSGKKGKSKDKSDKAASAPVKKVSPVITGFLKMTSNLKTHVPITKESSVKDLLEILRSNVVEVKELRTLFVKKGWINAANDYKSGVAPDAYQAIYNGFGMDASEAKAARTYFPYLGKESSADSKDFWTAGN